MNTLIKMTLAFCLTLSCLDSIAQTKQEVSEAIFLEIMAQSEELNDLPELFDQTRTALIDTFKPKYQELKDPEIIALQEQLYYDVKNSSMYQGYMEGLKKSFIQDLNKEFSYDELIALNNLLKDPLFKRMESIREKNLASGEDFTENWTKKNEALVNSFLERQKEINHKLKVNIMLNTEQRSQ